MTTDPKAVAAGERRVGVGKAVAYVLIGIPLLIAWPAICMLAAAALAIFLAGTVCFGMGRAALWLLNYIATAIRAKAVGNG